MTFQDDLADTSADQVRTWSAAYRLVPPKSSAKNVLRVKLRSLEAAPDIPFLAAIGNTRHEARYHSHILPIFGKTAFQLASELLDDSSQAVRGQDEVRFEAFTHVG